MTDGVQTLLKVQGESGQLIKYLVPNESPIYGMVLTIDTVKRTAENREVKKTYLRRLISSTGANYTPFRSSLWVVEVSRLSK